MNPASSPRGAAELLGYALIAGSVWLSWEIVKAPVLQRAPPGIAIRLAPGSPEVLRRAAEAELLADRPENAAALADASLAKAPFNARALRVRGLVAARADQNKPADDMLTLAGNWSLRDDPAHAWLIENRLRQGDYGSAFAHADTLVRRRSDLNPQVFNLFTTAAVGAPPALRALGGLLAAAPPWRRSYWFYLGRKPEGAALLLSLAVGLERTKNPLDKFELSWLYQKWAKEGRFEAIRLLRERIGRPSQASLIVNGDFSTPLQDQIAPFAWDLGAGSGLTVEVTPDDLQPSNAGLRVDYDGYGTAPIANQLLLLQPGSYEFSFRSRLELVSNSADVSWVVKCANNSIRLAETRSAARQVETGTWSTTSIRFTVPVNGCPAQRLSLIPIASDRRAPITIWLDDLRISDVSVRDHH